MEFEIVSPKHGKFVVYYDEADHELVNRHIWGVRCQNGKVYARTNDYKKGVSNYIDMHRLMLGFPKSGIDHIDGNGLNNTRNNLRVSTQAQNTRNQRIKKTNTSGYKGVSFCKKKKKYSCHITLNYKHIFGGYFKNPIEAAKKYNFLAIKYHGEFAKLNEI